MPLWERQEVEKMSRPAGVTAAKLNRPRNSCVYVCLGSNQALYHPSGGATAMGRKPKFKPDNLPPFGRGG